MSKFIKLTNIIFNTNDLHSIIIKPNKYYINFATKILNGSIWYIEGYGISVISSKKYKIKICKFLNPNDYKKVSDWIDKN